MSKKHSETFNEDPEILETEKDVVTEEGEDRSSYNCPECKGEGINVFANVICPVCAGKGKI